MAPYHPPHCGASWFDASILPISLLPQSGHFNSLSSFGPNGARTSKLDLHWWQVSSQVIMTSRLFSSGIGFDPDTTFPFCSLEQLV
jgi:hypothetical protein